MKANWTVLPRGDVRSMYAGPSVSMNTKGRIVMSRVTHKMLNEPKAVYILFDEINNRIGLQSAQPNTKNAYPVCKLGRNGAKLIYGFRLFREFGFTLEETKKFVDPTIDDQGTLVLDLRTAQPSKRALAQNRYRAKTQKREE